MKKIFTIWLLLASLQAFAQKDYSGFYSLDNKTSSRDLTLLKIDSTHYKFWVIAASEKFLNTGDGIVEIKDGSGVFRSASGEDYGIMFTMNRNMVALDLPKENKGGHFEFGSHVFGSYPLRKKEKIKPAEFRNKYVDGQECKVIVPKGILYRDAACTIDSKMYFIRGDKMVVPASGSDGENTYVEYLTTKGKFISGWLKKGNVIVLNN